MSIMKSEEILFMCVYDGLLICLCEKISTRLHKATLLNQHFTIVQKENMAVIIVHNHRL